MLRGSDWGRQRGAQAGVGFKSPLQSTIFYNTSFLPESKDRCPWIFLDQITQSARGHHEHQKCLFFCHKTGEEKFIGMTLPMRMRCRYDKFFDEDFMSLVSVLAFL